MKKISFYTIAVLLMIYSCSDNDSDGETNVGTVNNSQLWSIPISEVKDGGPGKDGIPSIDSPIFISVADVDFLDDDDLIIGVVNGNVAKAYPHEIMDWHEVVNDKINGESITINYCPLTGTAFGWKSQSNATETTFGVSGLLYNNNLILYDRNTGSNWSQLKLECVNGELIGDTPVQVNVVETNWKTWKNLYPNTQVLSTDTGFSRNYGTYPYGPYRTSHSYFIFQPTLINNALQNKQRIYAIIDNDKSKVFQFTEFVNGQVLIDTFKGKNYLIVGNEYIMQAFWLTGDQLSLSFQYDFNDSESFFKDNEGNKWSVFGEAIEGPRTGQKLTPAKSVISYWFAIAAFYPDPQIHN